MTHSIADKEQLIRKDEPIEVCGLTLRPITVEHYEEYQACKQALLLRLSMLPAVYASQTFLAGVYAYTVDALTATGEAPTWLSCIATILCLSLGMPTQLASQAMRFVTDTEKQNKLKYLIVKQVTDEGIKQIQLTPKQFNEVRETIALQNGDKLPDESENIELLEALAIKAQVSQAELDMDIGDLIASVAYHSNVREKEIREWTIREFEKRREAIDRAINHTICGNAEGNGASWKNGNPYPSWCFNRKPDSLHGFTPIDETLGKLGQTNEWLESQIQEKGN